MLPRKCIALHRCGIRGADCGANRCRMVTMQIVDLYCNVCPKCGAIGMCNTAFFVVWLLIARNTGGQNSVWIATCPD